MSLGPRRTPCPRLCFLLSPSASLGRSLFARTVSVTWKIDIVAGRPVVVRASRQAHRHEDDPSRRAGFVRPGRLLSSNDGKNDVRGYPGPVLVRLGCLDWQCGTDTAAYYL
jgi:hypothetical protein